MRRPGKNFTLIELLVVTAIIAIADAVFNSIKNGGVQDLTGLFK